MTLRLENISIRIGGVPLIAAFSLSVQDGEIITLMGPSGSGKSSLLAYIAGDLTPPLNGIGGVVLNGADLETVGPEQRRIGRLFQDDLLFPHMTVGQNLLFGMARGDRSERIAMMRAALAQAGLEGFEDRQPHTLSGGQRARVALMRALMAKPDCMLLDEPFNKLDKALRANLRAYVFNHLKIRNIACLMVTHDIEDAPEGGRILHIGHEGELKIV